jgi:hypothetical protein
MSCRVEGNSSQGAYVLAMANIHKPWARRWMNQNGHRWATAIYRERQRKARNLSDEDDAK